MKLEGSIVKKKKLQNQSEREREGGCVKEATIVRKHPDTIYTHREEREWGV